MPAVLSRGVKTSLEIFQQLIMASASLIVFTKLTTQFISTNICTFAQYNILEY